MAAEGVSSGVDNEPVIEEEVLDVFGDKGLLKKVLVEGDGPKVPKGCSVWVHYVASYLNGIQFDSTYSTGDPFQFVQGKGQVVPGLDLGVLTMRQNEHAEFICRCNYGYGEKGTSEIPPNTTLRLNVHVIEWDPEDYSPKKDGSVLKYLLESGIGFDSPKSGALVDVTLVGKYRRDCKDNEFFNEKIKFHLDEGIAVGIPRGIEKVLKKMVMGEKSKVFLKPEYGFGIEGKKSFGVPPNTPLTYFITLNSFEIVKDWWMLNCDEKLALALSLKLKGVKYFKDGSFALALKLWKKQCTLLEPAVGFRGIDDKRREELLKAGYLNCSIAYAKLKDMINVRYSCTQVLVLDKDNIKALFRRGQALLQLNEPEEALADFTRVLELEPNNKAAMNQIQICKVTAIRIKQMEKKIFANMFDKFARKDREKEEEKAKKEEDVLAKVGEWGIGERGHQPTDFERENPNILMLDKDGDFKDM